MAFDLTYNPANPRIILRICDKPLGATRWNNFTVMGIANTAVYAASLAAAMGIGATNSGNKAVNASAPLIATLSALGTGLSANSISFLRERTSTKKRVLYEFSFPYALQSKVIKASSSTVASSTARRGRMQQVGQESQKIEFGSVFANNSYMPGITNVPVAVFRGRDYAAEFRNFFTQFEGLFDLYNNTARSKDWTKFNYWLSNANLDSISMEFIDEIDHTMFEIKPSSWSIQQSAKEPYLFRWHVEASIISNLLKTSYHAIPVDWLEVFANVQMPEYEQMPITGHASWLTNRIRQIKNNTNRIASAIGTYSNSFKGIYDNNYDAEEEYNKAMERYKENQEEDDDEAAAENNAIKKAKEATTAALAEEALADDTETSDDQEEAAAEAAEAAALAENTEEDEEENIYTETINSESEILKVDVIDSNTGINRSIVGQLDTETQERLEQLMQTENNREVENIISLGVLDIATAEDKIASLDEQIIASQSISTTSSSILSDLSVAKMMLTAKIDFENSDDEEITKIENALTTVKEVATLFDNLNLSKSEQTDALLASEDSPEKQIIAQLLAEQTEISSMQVDMDILDQIAEIDVEAFEAAMGIINQYISPTTYSNRYKEEIVLSSDININFLAERLGADSNDLIVYNNLVAPYVSLAYQQAGAFLGSLKNIKESCSSLKGTLVNPNYPQASSDASELTTGEQKKLYFDSFQTENDDTQLIVGDIIVIKKLGISFSTSIQSINTNNQGYKLTTAAITELKEEKNVRDLEVIAQLSLLKNTLYSTKEDFENAVNDILTTSQKTKYFDQILNVALLDTNYLILNEQFDFTIDQSYEVEVYLFDTMILLYSNFVANTEITNSNPSLNDVIIITNNSLEGGLKQFRTQIKSINFLRKQIYLHDPLPFPLDSTFEANVYRDRPNEQILSPGDTVKIPLDSSTVNSQTDIYGRTWEINDGVIQFGKTLTGHDLFAQEFMLRLKTKKGTYIVEPEYGSTIIEIMQSPYGDSERNMRLIEAIKECASQDSRVAEVQIYEKDIKKENEVITFNCGITLIDGTSVTRKYRSI